jgi:glucose-6-phosphate isomerase
MHMPQREAGSASIGFVQALNLPGNRHEMPVANVYAQAEALALGRTSEGVMSAGTPEWLVPHRTFEDNRPPATIRAEHLTPETLGKLTAFYEHCVFTQARSGRLIRSTSGAWNSAGSWPNASARYS